MTTANMEEAAQIAANIPVPASGFHHSRGVYPNGSHKDNGVDPAHLVEHIDYNLGFRPGRALFVDGKCLYRGNVSEELCQETEKELQGVTASRCTAPYW